jgi:2-polyprenyl-3-methyl-5-hydroxy-6-metoxy-1,4-benzoquinol methylase
MNAAPPFSVAARITRSLVRRGRHGRFLFDRSRFRARTTAGRRLVGAGAKLLASPAFDHVDVPRPLQAAGRTFDVVADLVAYTGLGESEVRALLSREPENFRTEWHGFPARFRTDHWFYLSSRMYLFANAVHFTDDRTVDRLVRLGSAGLPVLDFGGGTGNLALALAAHGLTVDYVELSALQKDFTRFRVDRHQLAAQVRVLDAWGALAEGRYGLVCAFDVLEHLPDVDDVVARLVEGLAPGGMLVENTIFGPTRENPMHLDDDHGLVALLRDRLSLESDAHGFRTWRLTTQPARP